MKGPIQLLLGRRFFMRIAGLILMVSLALVCFSPGLCKQGRGPGGPGGPGDVGGTGSGRQSGARREALGGGGVALTGDILSSFYNPAGIYGATGLSVAMSFGDAGKVPGYGDYRLIGAGLPLKKWGVVGLTWYGFDYEYTLDQAGPDQSGPDDEVHSGKASVYTLTFAGEPAEDLYVGFNLNTLSQSFSGETENAFWPDLGLIKLFRLPGRATVRHRIILGSSLANLTRSSIDIPGGSEELPSTLRIGGSYSVSYSHRSWMNMARLLNVLIHAEYRSLLNLSYGDGPRLGAEVTVLEMLSARLGYYYEDTGDFEEEIGKARIERSTFGLGLALPVYRFTGGSVPLRAALDWARIEVQPYLTDSSDTESYSSWTVAVDWYY
jgi:hypothetical protein